MICKITINIILGNHANKWHYHRGYWTSVYEKARVVSHIYWSCRIAWVFLLEGWPREKLARFFRKLLWSRGIRTDDEPRCIRIFYVPIFHFNNVDKKLAVCYNNILLNEIVLCIINWRVFSVNSLLTVQRLTFSKIGRFSSDGISNAFMLCPRIFFPHFSPSCHDKNTGPQGRRQ